jgi:hypothetical protein
MKELPVATKDQFKFTIFTNNHTDSNSKSAQNQREINLIENFQLGMRNHHET